MNLDIIFNIDYASQGVGLLQYDLPKYIEYIQVGDMSQFQRLIKSLDDEVNCHIWVHPSLAADRVTAGFSSKILLECVPELQRLNIQFLQITRSTGRAEGNQFVDVAKMLDVRKNAKSYTAMELKEILFPVPTETQIEQSKIRERLVDSLKSDSDRVNVRLNLLRSFLKGNVSAEQEWFKTVLASRYWKLFSFPYWNFKSDVLENFLNLSDIGSDLLDTKNLQVSEVIIFDRDSSKWKIDISFFDQVSNRFERSHPDYAERLFIATTLYVVHEVVHKTHNLDSNTVDGIGNFPKIVEEADYQADAIAVLTELSFFIYEKGGIEKLTAKELIGKLLDTIKIAIETTFSFNPIGSSL